MPSTTTAIPAIFRTVKTDCTLPPKATVRQLIRREEQIAPTATTCRGPNCQSSVLAQERELVLGPTRRSSGRNAARKIARPEPRLAIEALPATMKRCQPNRNAAASP